MTWTLHSRPFTLLGVFDFPEGLSSAQKVTHCQGNLSTLDGLDNHNCSCTTPFLVSKYILHKWPILWSSNFLTGVPQANMALLINSIFKWVNSEDQASNTTSRLHFLPGKREPVQTHMLECICVHMCAYVCMGYGSLKQKKSVCLLMNGPQ